MKQKIIGNNIPIIFIINLILLFPLMIYGGQNFSIDSYGIMLDVNVHINAFVGSFRWFGAFIYKIFSLSGHNPILNSNVDVVLFVILVAGAIAFLVTELIKLMDKKDILSYLVVNLSVLVSILNVWFCDVLSFPECIFITAVGLVFCIFAIVAFINAEKLWHYLISGLFLLFATGVYQQFICIFTIYIIIVCNIKLNKYDEVGFKSIIIRYIKPIILIISTGIVYLGIGKATQMLCNVEPNSRIALSISSIIDNLIYFVSNQHSYLKGRGFFSTELLTISFITIGFIWLVSFIISYRKNKYALQSAFVILSFIAAYVAAYLPGILSTSHAARAMFALFSVFALFAIGTLVLTEKRFFKSLIVAVLSVVLISNITISINCELRLKQQNDIDMLWSQQILNEINNYETKYGIEIKEIYFTHDMQSELNITESATNTRYSIEAMLNYYGERTFSCKKMSDAMHNDYFNKKDWSEFSSKQLIFEGDTLYLCCY